MAFEKIDLSFLRKKTSGDVRASLVAMNKKDIYIRFNLKPEIMEKLQWKDNCSLDVAEGTNEDLGLLKFFRVMGDSGLNLVKIGKAYEFKLNSRLLKYNNIKNYNVRIHDLIYEIEGSTLTIMLSPELLVEKSDS